MATETRAVLFTSRPSAGVLTDAYTVASATQVVVSTLAIINTSTSAADTAQVTVAPSGAADTAAHTLVPTVDIAAKSMVTMTIGITLGATDKIRVKSTNGTVNFHGYGVTIA